MAYTFNSPNIDLHSHFWITTDLGKLGFDKHPRNLDTIVDSMEQGDIQISALTNSQDYRFEYVLDNIKRTRTAKTSQIDTFPNCMIVDGKKAIYRGEELHTDKGDLVVVGADRTLWHPKKSIELKEAEKIAKSENLLLLIPHPFSGHGGIGNYINEVCESADAIELNPNCSVVIPKLLDKREDNDKARKYADMHNKPLIWTSDSHWEDETGRGYFTPQTALKFSDGREALSAVKSSLKNEYKTKGRLATPYELGRLIAVSLYDLDVRRPLGLVKSTFEANF